MEQAIEKFIDIYSKLLIGVISFIAPITSYLLSTYFGDRSTLLKILNEKKSKIDILLAEDVNMAVEKGKVDREFIAQTNSKMRTMEEEIDEKVVLLDFLNPRIRISELFSWLFISMGLLFAVIFVKGRIFIFYNDLLTIILLSSSFIFFIGALRAFRLVAWRLIRAKEILEEDKQEIKEAKKFEPIEQEK